MYNEKVMESFKNPKHAGEIKDANGSGKVGNPVCGDLMEVFIKVKKENKDGNEIEIIEDCKVKTFGCVAAFASSDVLCDLAIGKTLDEALNITKQDILNELGEVPKEKVHCSVLASDALKRAIEDHKKRKK